MQWRPYKIKDPKRIKIIFSPLCFVFIFLVFLNANALMPPGHYDGLAQNSKVKAIAKIREDWFLYFHKNKISGYLKLSSYQNPDTGIFQFDQEFLTGDFDGNRQLFSINTQYRDYKTIKIERILIKHTDYLIKETIVYPEKKYEFKSIDNLDIKIGPLVEETVDVIPIPQKTISDFLVFNYIKKLLYQKRTFYIINLIETLDLNLKKNILIRYEGKDENKDNLHKFSQTGSFKALYWLDNDHNVIEAIWDKDKRFIRTDKMTAMTCLQ